VIRHPLVIVATAIVAVCGAVPLAMLAVDGIGSDALGLLTSGTTWRLFGRSLVLATAVTAVALVIGVPAGLLLGRCDVIARRALLVVHVFPLFVPPLLLALGWFQLPHPDALFGVLGVVVVLGLAFAPIVTLLTVIGLDGVDPSLEEAARITASPARVAVRISLPLARSTIALGVLVVFALAFAELGVPMLLRVDVYPVAVFARLGGLDYAPGEAFVLGLPQLVIAGMLVAIERRWIRAPLGGLAIRRDRTTFALGRRRIAASLGCLAIAALGALPLIALATRADWSGVWTWAAEPLRNSLVDGAIAATAMTACGLVLGHALARRDHLARWIDAGSVLVFVTPAATLGAGLIAVWNRPATQAIYATSAIIVIGYVARYAVLAIRPIAAAIARTSPHLEEAAALAGAGYLGRLARIVVPIHARALAASWLLALVFCLRDVETAVLYYPAGSQTLPVQIFTLEANGAPGTVAALATLHVAVTAIVVGCGVMVIRWRR
jgi:iron(III) transport system permease protein